MTRELTIRLKARLFRSGCAWPGALLALCLVAQAEAGGSGLNVALVINTASTNSVVLGNYYAERRQLPPQNVIRINWTGGNVGWTRSEFQTFLFNPLTNALAARQLTGQIDYVALSMDIPYLVTESGSANGTTSVLLYGFKADGPPPPGAPASCSLPPASFNSYAGSEDIFRQIAPGNTANTFLATMLTASNLATAKQLVDQGVNGDSTFPTQPVLLAKSTDVRNVRFYFFDNTEFDARVRGSPSAVRTNLNSPFGQFNLFGWQNGMQNFSVSSNAFVPGAMADNLTSFGGVPFVPNGQTTLLEFIHAGASGSYGTVIEPCIDSKAAPKFPSPQNYFYQARGFSLAECYYQSLTNPHQGLIIGEPLSAPFRLGAAGDWIGLPEDALLSGSTNLALTFNGPDTLHAVQQIDLFLDGRFLQTLTNIAPRQNNRLHVALKGHSMTYAIPNNATLRSVTAGLTGVLNQPANQNQTDVTAFARGDRIELQSIDPNTPGADIPVTVSNSIGTATALTTFVASSRSNFLDTVAYGLRTWSISGTELLLASLRLTVTKTNGEQITLTATNGSSLGQLVLQIFNAVNATNALQGADGLVAEDYFDFLTEVNFNLRARSPGLAAAQIDAQLTAFGAIVVTPPGNLNLDENLSDLRPRNHLYLSAGATNLPVAFPFNTTVHADGWHELTAVAYEGSHVRAQGRIDRRVRIQNTSLSATFACSVSGTNAAVEATLHFEVTANTVARVELFSTGGLLATVTNLSSALFDVPGSTLGAGLHPFYALVTNTGGQSYRTETRFIRLIEVESPFTLSIFLSPVSIYWPSVAGRSYDVLSADILSIPFAVRETVVPTNAGLFQWIDPAPADTQRFYRVRVSP